MLGLAITPVAQHLSRGQAVVPDPVLNLAMTDDNVMQVSTDLTDVTITVDAPSVYAGTYTLHVPDLTAGPVNLAPPVVAGTPEPGQTLTATEGLWVYDTALGGVTISGSWLLDGVELAGATATSLVVDPAHVDHALRYGETAVQNGSSRSAVSAAFAVTSQPATSLVFDTFTSGAAISLGGYIGESGLSYWHPGGLPVTGTVNGGRLTHSSFKNRLLMRGTQTYTDCFAEGTLRRGAHTGSSFSVGLAVRITPEGGGYFLVYRQPGSNYFELRKDFGGSVTSLATYSNNIAGFAAEGDMIEFRLEAQGDVLRMLWRLPGDTDWTVMGSVTDGDISQGGIGVRVGGPSTLGDPGELDKFGGDML